MTDLLVRAVPREDALLVAAAAERSGVSQTEYLRRIIHEAVQRNRRPLRDIAGSCTGLFPANADEVLAALDAEWDE